MRRVPYIILAAVFLFGCSVQQESASVERAPPNAAEPSSAGIATMSGAKAYETTCAQCHDAGLDGAPVTRNPVDWESRSPLWQAVLIEHAKDGYFGMPAKGGNPDLPDATVTAAAEYMLEITFPNLPPD